MSKPHCHLLQRTGIDLFPKCVILQELGESKGLDLFRFCLMCVYIQQPSPKILPTNPFALCSD